jgi:hypothetical protein
MSLYKLPGKIEHHYMLYSSLSNVFDYWVISSAKNRQIKEEIVEALLKIL